MRLVLATANADKAAEIAAIVTGHELVPRPVDVPEVVEDADTLEGNARLKARALCEATGEAAVADDTGLEVDALGGAPGVRSARFAGRQATDADNVARLLHELDGVPAPDRTARFRTVALVAFPDGTELVADGAVEGVIAESPRGHDGFGYDPVFVPVPSPSRRLGTDPADPRRIGTQTLVSSGRTFAEMPPDEKHALSHRGRAFRALAEQLADRG